MRGAGCGVMGEEWRVRGERVRCAHSGDTTPCRMTGVTLHGIVSPDPRLKRAAFHVAAKILSAPVAAKPLPSEEGTADKVSTSSFSFWRLLIQKSSRCTGAEEKNAGGLLSCKRTKLVSRKWSRWARTWTAKTFRMAPFCVIFRVHPAILASKKSSPKHHKR